MTARNPLVHYSGLGRGSQSESSSWVQALRVPPLQFHQHRAEQFVVGRAGDERSLDDLPHEGRDLAAFGGPADPVEKFGVGVGGEHHDGFTVAIKDPCHLSSVGNRAHKGEAVANLVGQTVTPLFWVQVGCN